MNFYQLYVKTDCPFCENAVKLLESKDRSMVVTVLDRAPDQAVSNIKTAFGHPTVPIVIEVKGNQQRLIGGFSELKKEIDSETVTVPYEEMTPEQKQEDDLFWDHGNGD